MKRIAILDEDGTTEIGGVRYKLVPVEPTAEVVAAARETFGSHVEDTESYYRRILRRCEEFVSIFDLLDPFVDADHRDVLADLRVALGMDEPAKVAA